MNPALVYSSIRAKIEHYLAQEHHAQTSNTGIVALVAICMIFVSFVSNKPGSMGPLLQANIQNATFQQETLVKLGPLEGQMITINGATYYLRTK